MTIDSERKAMIDKLKVFMQRIGAIEPQYTDIFGNSVAGMPGRPAASASAANSGVSITLQIRQAASEIAIMYQNYASYPEAIQQFAVKVEELEGLLMVAVTVGVLSTQEADACIAQLHDLRQSIDSGFTDEPAA